MIHVGSLVRVKALNHSMRGRTGVVEEIRKSQWPFYVSFSGDDTLFPLCDEEIEEMVSSNPLVDGVRELTVAVRNLQRSLDKILAKE